MKPLTVKQRVICAEVSVNQALELTKDLRYEFDMTSGIADELRDIMNLLIFAQNELGLITDSDSDDVPYPRWPVELLAENEAKIIGKRGYQWTRKDLIPGEYDD
jgi:hypothetical protein